MPKGAVIIASRVPFKGRAETAGVTVVRTLEEA
jgi:hypothetical protein